VKPPRRTTLAAATLCLVLVAAAAVSARLAFTGAGAQAAPLAAQATTASMSLAEWLAGHSPDWRVARLQDNPAVLVIEFPTLAAQGAAMNRLAALLEKAEAPRDRVLGNGELAELIARSGDSAQTFYQGHDYSGSGLARFFDLARRQSQPLNDEEHRLLQLLLAHGVLLQTPQGLQAPGLQAVVTFTAVQADDRATAADETIDAHRRESVLRHEISHGHFFTRPGYAEHCRRFWREALNEQQREAFRRHLAALGYDRRDEDLMLNEAQAFLLHTPDPRAFSAGMVGISDDELADLRARFWRGLPAEPEPGRVVAAPAPR
jgi:hypothetical protein